MFQVLRKFSGDSVAQWVTDVGNERGEVLNCVLTVGEGMALNKMIRGIIHR